MDYVTQTILKERLFYDEITGVFKWITQPSNRVKINSTAGSIGSEGYCQIKINGVSYKAHRLAFLYMEGYFPEQQVDHINGIKTDNRWLNLRHVNQSCNKQNQRININSSSGIKGVNWNKKDKKWKSRITIDNKTFYIGAFSCKLNAALARMATEDCLPNWHCDSLCQSRKLTLKMLDVYIQRVK